MWQGAVAIFPSAAQEGRALKSWERGPGPREGVLAAPLAWSRPVPASEGEVAGARGCVRARAPLGRGGGARRL